MCVPQKAAAAMGGFGPLALCTRVSNTLTLTDPATLRSVQLDVRAPSLALLPCPADGVACAGPRKAAVGCGHGLLGAAQGSMQQLRARK